MLLDKLLPRLKSNGHKVLLFSQMVKIIDIIADNLQHTDYTMERLDGSIRGEDRRSAIKRFTNGVGIYIYICISIYSIIL